MKQQKDTRDIESLANEIAHKVMCQALREIAREVGTKLPAHGEKADMQKVMAAAAVMECLGKDFLTRVAAAVMNENGRALEPGRAFLLCAAEEIEGQAWRLVQQVAARGAGDGAKETT